MNRKKIKLVIASGKGGVGKSMLSSSLSMIFSKTHKIVAVDCDVDAPNLAVWLNEFKNWEQIDEISVSKKPIINNKKFKSKKEKIECLKKCKFGALYLQNGDLKLNKFLCEGCGACKFFAPKGAIRMKAVKNAKIMAKKTKYGFYLISGQLFPGETGSGKVVSKLKDKAENFDYKIMIIDSAPGTGCPVIASFQGADFALLITEPTLSGISDLKRVLEVVNHFKLDYSIVINKWDINKKISERICKIFKGKVIGKISYDQGIFKAISNLTPILETRLKEKIEIEKIAKIVKRKIFA